jgi:hypothetical protein
MKLSEIIRQVNRDIDDDYEASDITDWVNRCLDDLSPIAKKQAAAVIESPYTLPSDLYELRFVAQNNEFLDPLSFEDMDSDGYKKWGDSLILQNREQSSLTLYYYRKFNHVENADDIPELEDSFHDLLILFCLGNLQFTEEDYDERPDTFLRYNARKEEYQQFISKRDRKGRVTEKVIW